MFPCCCTSSSSSSSQGTCEFCPEGNVPFRYEVVIPSMSRSPDIASANNVLFKDSGCPDLCSSTKLIGSRILTQRDSCLWVYGEDWRPICDAYEGTPFNTLLLRMTIAEISPGNKRVRLNIGACDDTTYPYVCGGNSYDFAVYQKVFAVAGALSTCTSFTLDLCDFSCNFFVNEYNCVWPSTLTVEAA